jgi:hypothetical protein
MKRERGRPTIRSNHLVGIHNNWVVLLESSWPEIGWLLLSVKENGLATTDQIRSAMAPLREKNNNSLAVPYFEEDLSTSTAHEVRQCRKVCANLEDRVRLRFNELEAQFARCLDAGRALESLGISDGEQVELETIRRYTLYAHACRRFRLLRDKADQLEREVRSREAFVCQSQLLDYLHSKRGRVEPRKLASALAGLPTMNWRQSRIRCYGLPCNSERGFNYQILEIILKLTKRLHASLENVSPGSIESAFRKLPNQRRSSMRFLRDNWRAFRLTIEAMGAESISPGELSYVVARRFIARAMAQKSPSEQFLSDSEQLKI